MTTPTITRKQLGMTIEGPYSSNKKRRKEIGHYVLHAGRYLRRIARNVEDFVCGFWPTLAVTGLAVGFVLLVIGEILFS